MTTQRWLDLFVWAGTNLLAPLAGVLRAVAVTWNWSWRP